MGRIQTLFEVAADAVMLVRAQHRELDALLLALLRTCSNPERRALLAEMSDLLTIHLTLEERIFHPGLRELGAGPLAGRVVERVETDEHDHIQLKALLGELLGLDTRDPAFETSAHHLRERLRDHAADQERRQLHGLRARVSATRLRRLAYEMRVLEFELRCDFNKPRREVVERVGPSASA